MPALQKIYTLTITPEQFLEACSATELFELSMLLQSNRYQDKMMQGEFVHDPVPERPQLPADRLENTAGWNPKYGQE